MIITAADGYRVTVEQSDTLGSNWIVRVYRKKLFFRKLISSDWFLDGPQAERFARQLVVELRLGRGAGIITTRTPGWTLRPPAK
jgi:hypothetical protein